MKYLKTLNELNKSTYLSAADKLDDQDDAYGDQYGELTRNLRKHAIYMDVQKGSDTVLKKILTDLKNWDEEYKSIMVDVDLKMKEWDKRKFHPRTQKEEYKKWMEEKDDTWISMREDIFNRKDKLMQEIIDYCNLEVGQTLGIIDDYDNKEIKPKISQITIDEVRFHSTNSIELQDLIYDFASGDARNITVMTRNMDKYKI